MGHFNDYVEIIIGILSFIGSGLTYLYFQRMWVGPSPNNSFFLNKFLTFKKEVDIHY